MSPVDTPCKYNHGNAASTAFARRTYGGTSVERNTAGSMMRERAFGTRTPTGPKPVNNSRSRLRAVTHHRRAPLFIPLLRELRQKFIELRLQRLANQALGTLSQHRAQQILPLWLAQWNYRILFHGGVTPLWVAEIRLRQSNSSRSRRLLQLILVHQIQL